MTKSAKCLEKAVALDPNCQDARLLLYPLYNNKPWFLGGNKKKAKVHLTYLEQHAPIKATELKVANLGCGHYQERLKIWRDLLKALRPGTLRLTFWIYSARPPKRG